MFGRNQNDDKDFFSETKDEKKKDNKEREAKPAGGQPFPPQRPRPDTLPPRAEAAGIPQRQEGVQSGVRPITAAHSDNKVLTISEEISLSGEIKRCDKLIIQGEADVSLEGTRVIEVAQTGVFRGDTEVEDADIAGVYTGTLTANNRLIIRRTGRVEGNIRYKELVVEAGGTLTGEVSTVES